MDNGTNITIFSYKVGKETGLLEGAEVAKHNLKEWDGIKPVVWHKKANVEIVLE